MIVNYDYVVEKLEGTQWVPKCRYNFEDKEQFKVIAQNPAYRILHDNKDVTKSYNKNYVAIGGGISQQSINEAVTSEPVTADTAVSVEEVISPMKPSEYKNLSDEDKHTVQNKISEMLDNKAKRNDIMKTLNVTESTYDMIRQDMKVTKEVEAAEPPKPTLTPVATVHKATPHRRGLLGR